MAMHDGHRERLRSRFLKEGLDHFEPINVLELLLFYCIPRVDTNPIAHRLLDTFGSLPNVFEASVDELMKVEGVGKSAALFLALVNSTNRYYLTKKQDNSKCLLRREDYTEELRPHFVGRKNEVLYILCLDAQGRKICCKMVSEGTVSSSAFSMRQVAEIALGVNAAIVILAHNHPNGYALPSNDDYKSTQAAIDVFASMDVRMYDHLIFCDDDVFSLINNS